MKLASINPYTETVIAEMEYDALPSVIVELKSLKENNSWPSLSAFERAGFIRLVGKELEKHKAECAQLITAEMGKPIRQSTAEIEKCILTCDYFADHVEFLDNEELKSQFAKSYVRFDPLGVILGVMPWNYPFWQVFRFAIPALMIGNRICVKHASNTSMCAKKMDEIFCSVLPPKTYKNVLVAGSHVSQLIDSEYVDAVSITGSTSAGSKVAEAAGRNIKKVVLELGGSDPFIVLRDADIDGAASAASNARFINGGQSCIASKRFIVEKTVADEFTTKFIEHVKKLKMDDPLQDSVDIGPLARGDLREELHSIVTRSVKMGAKIMTGGFIPNSKGYFYPPTVLTDVTEKMPVILEETFGPVAPILIVNNELEAIRIANNSEYGLGASVWTRDIKKGEEIAAKLEAGFIAINDTVKSDPKLPFGGLKKSGYGRELSYFAIREFSNIKTVVVK